MPHDYWYVNYYARDDEKNVIDVDRIGKRRNNASEQSRAEQSRA